MYSFIFHFLYTKKADKQYNTKYERYNRHIVLTTNNLHCFQLLHAMLLLTMSRCISLTCPRSVTAPPPGCLVFVPSNMWKMQPSVHFNQKAECFCCNRGGLNVLIPENLETLVKSVVQLCCGAVH